MGGIFGVVSSENCAKTLFYGTDYHSHLGTEHAGMAVLGKQGFYKTVHTYLRFNSNPDSSMTIKNWKDILVLAPLTMKHPSR